MWYRLADDEVEAMLMPADEVKFIRRKNKKFHGREAITADDDQ
jgi:hypothetical protein